MTIQQIRQWILLMNIVGNQSMELILLRWILCGRNLGYPDCFWEILKNVPRAKYYCFLCDQDDYWLPEKIESSVKCLEKVDSTIPAMTYCAFDYYNQNMEYLRSGENILNNYSFERGIYYTYAPGFTQMINRALVDSLDFDYIIGKNLAHDIWCQWIATSIGKIVPNKTVLAKFRRHESAVTSGNKSKLASVKDGGLLKYVVMK